MNFQSILFERTEDSMQEEALDTPVFFADLNLDQIINTITTGKEKYNLKPFFCESLNDVDAIYYRHEIMQDLEGHKLLNYVKTFAQTMSVIREDLTQIGKLYYKYQKDAWFFDSIEIYCAAITCFANDLSTVALKSRGFLAFREYLTNYAGSAQFTSLIAETKRLKADLSAVKYCLTIKGNSIKVRKYESEIDYSAEVEETFKKFKQGAVKDYSVAFPTWPEMNHIEAKVLDFVAKLYPDIFFNLEAYCQNNSNFMDSTVARFDREVQFYVAFIEYAETFRCAGLKLCFPRFASNCKEVHNCEGFDLALAHILIGENTPVVCNDFYLKDNERIFVVSGPNQGGKTTFARTFGQLHYLASIGCPVPGSEAQLFFFDRLFTHFEREEDIKTLRGKLEDDLIRMHDILSLSTSNSIIIMNEFLTSTTLQDAIFLSEKIIEKLIELDLLYVWVTFIDELASFGEQTVSMVGAVLPENPALRTYKIVRRPADGLAYATSLAEKYRVTYASLKERLNS